ncbi:MAG TPA: hypothetical protein VFI24_29030 [Pyrinomonadaceae bacterium]|nr:hypothetical protein [Pyrinomonadaceae bacterium]
MKSLLTATMHVMDDGIVETGIGNPASASSDVIAGIVTGTIGDAVIVTVIGIAAGATNGTVIYPQITQIR